MCLSAPARLGFSLVLLGPSTDAQSQPPPDIPNTTTCRTCTISATKLRELRDDAGTVGLDEPQTWVRDSRGWSYVGTVNDADALIVAPPGQAPALRRIGQMGSGPGEFRLIRGLAIGQGDSLFVWDGALLRMSVFTPAPELKYARSFPLTMELEPGGYAILPGSRILVNADMAKPEALGLPFHLLAADGKLQRSIGVGGGLFRRGEDREQLSRLFAMTGKTWWAVARTTYTLERWDSTGVEKTSRVRRPTWFKAGGLAPITMNESPGSLCTGVMALGMDTVLVVTIVADQRWKSGVSKKTSSHGDWLAVTDFSRAYDTMIEVVDLKANALLSSSRIDAALIRLSPSGIGMEATEDAQGRVVLGEWKLSWQRK